MLSAQEISTLRSPDMWRVNRMTPGLGLLAKQCAGKGAGLLRVQLPGNQAADKAASLERWKSFCRQLPDSDG